MLYHSWPFNAQQSVLIDKKIYDYNETNNLFSYVPQESLILMTQLKTISYLIKLLMIKSI